MLKIRIISNLIVVLSTSLLVGNLALNALNDSESTMLINVFLNTMHASFVVSSILYIIQFAKTKKTILLFFTALPLVFFIIAFIAIFWEFTFSNLLLLLFDFYTIFWFFNLLINDISTLSKK